MSGDKKIQESEMVDTIGEIVAADSNEQTITIKFKHRISGVKIGNNCFVKYLKHKK